MTIARITRRTFAPLLLTMSVALVAVGPAGAATGIPFNYRVNASTHLKKLNQTITVPPGTFKGTIDPSAGDGTGVLRGSITLPPATFTFKLAGILPLVTATARITQVKPVTGKVVFASPIMVTATATINFQIVSAYATGSKTNLVGNTCMTSKPMTVTMSGPADFAGPSTFTGVFTIPPLKTCGLATLALNQVIPGPGNTFTAVATPK